jgi:hypothetical protein
VALGRRPIDFSSWLSIFLLLSYLRHSAGTEAKSFGTKFPVQGAEPVARKGHEASPFMERRHHWEGEGLRLDILQHADHKFV